MEVCHIIESYGLKGWFRGAGGDAGLLGNVGVGRRGVLPIDSIGPGVEHVPTAMRVKLKANEVQAPALGEGRQEEATNSGACAYHPGLILITLCLLLRMVDALINLRALGHNGRFEK